MKVVRTVILSLILVFLAFVIYRAAKEVERYPLLLSVPSIGILRANLLFRGDTAL